MGRRCEPRALVLGEVARMHRMVDDLIPLAKSQRPDFLHLAAVSIDLLTREVHTKAEVLDAQVRWRLGQTADVVLRRDRQRLTQALVQLAQNAARHCPPGTSVTIASAVADDVRLWVADDGPGVDPEDQDRLFDRFQRGPRARTDTEGSGLGLAIVWAIAEAHGGHVALDSVPGRGSRFTIVLPADLIDLLETP